MILYCRRHNILLCERHSDQCFGGERCDPQPWAARFGWACSVCEGVISPRTDQRTKEEARLIKSP